MLREGICGLCPGGCAVVMDIDDDHIRSIKASRQFDPSCLCLRGRYSDQVIHSPDRVLTPKIRVGEKGEGRFRESTWEEALDYAAMAFLKVRDRYGAHALMSHFGRGAFDQVTADFLDFNRPMGGEAGFFAPLGSPNGAGVGSLCYQAFGLFAPLTTMGLFGNGIEPDIEGAETVVIWGTNPPTASPPLMYRRLKKAAKKGTKLITIDHYASIMAKNSDHLILIRSGTDGFLILALIHELICRQDYDKEFVEKYTYGFDRLADYVSDFTKEKALSVAGVREEDFELLYRALTQTRATLLTYTGLEYSNCGVQTIRGVYALWALLGKLDRPGGLLLRPKNRKKNLINANNAGAYAIDIQPIGADSFPLYTSLTGQAQFMCFPEAVLEGKPYKIAGLLNIGSTISLNYPSSRDYEKALKALDICVVVDRFMTKDTLYADVVLPATTYFEEETYHDYGQFVRRRERLVTPRGQSRSNIRILHDLAEKLGYGELYPKNDEEILTRRFAHEPDIVPALKAQGIYKRSSEKTTEYEKYARGKLRADGKPGFETPTGRFEFFSTVLAAYGYDGLPTFCFSQEGPYHDQTENSDYPLILNTGARIMNTFRTQHLNIPELVAYQPEPYVLMHPEDARRYGLREGDAVWVETRRDKISVRLKCIDGILPGEVELNIGGGGPHQAAAWRKANANFLTDRKNVDPISGFPVFKNLMCRIEKKA